MEEVTLEELLSFYKLYIDEDYILSSSFWISMLVLYANTAFYIFDFYHLMKRKSRAETMAVLAIPATVSVMGAALASLFVHVPGQTELKGFSDAFESKSLYLELMLVAVCYLFLWFLSFYLQKDREKKDVRRWLISCMPDYCFAAMIFICFLCNRILGESPFQSWPDWVLWIYLYAVYFLSCKIVLLAVGLFVRIYSARITVFKWREGKNPAAFLTRYFVIYQNAILRNIALFELGILIPLTLALNSEGWTLEGIGIMGFLYLCAVFVILFSLTPIMGTFHKFRTWGEPNRIKGLFCREYFVEEPIYKDKDYTVTRHFLIDEQSPAAIYYWPQLESMSGWRVNAAGRSRMLYFRKGEHCELPEDASPELIAHAKKWIDREFYAFEGAGAVSDGNGDRYLVFVQKLAIFLVMLMAFVTYVIR